MMISIFRSVDLSHFERRKKLFISLLCAWRRGAPSPWPGRRKRACQCERAVVPTGDRVSIGAMADIPAGKVFREVSARQRIPLPPVCFVCLVQFGCSCCSHSAPRLISCQQAFNLQSYLSNSGQRIKHRRGFLRFSAFSFALKI